MMAKKIDISPLISICRCRLFYFFTTILILLLKIIFFHLIVLDGFNLWGRRKKAHKFNSGQYFSQKTYLSAIAERVDKLLQLQCLYVVHYITTSIATRAHKWQFHGDHAATEYQPAGALRLHISIFLTNLQSFLLSFKIRYFIAKGMT